MTDPAIDYAAVIAPVARRLWGEPNAELSSKFELRWGNHGARVINVKKGVWHDHEAGQGGGVIDLIERETGKGGREAIEWLVREGLAAETATKANGKDHTRKIVAKKFIYEDLNGATVFMVERVEFQSPDGSYVATKDGSKRTKSFRQRRPDPDRPGSWIWNVEGVLPLIYKLPEVTEAIANENLILIVEGEAKADLLTSWNIAATCCPGGANKWRPEHSTYLAGADVVILPDNDAAGREHADAVAASLQGIAASVRLLELPGLRPKGDVIDWSAAGGDVEQLHHLIAEKARPWSPEDNAEQSDELPPLVYTDITRDPIPPREWAVRDRIPARNVTLLSGEGAVGKSILLLQLCTAHVLGRDWIGMLPTPGPVIYLGCEDDDDEICRRLEAIAVYYGATRKEIAEGLRVLSFAGRDAALAVADKTGRLRSTPLFEQLKREALALRPKLIVLDTVADVFGGNENDRAQVRQFITIMRGLSLEADSSIVVAAHPSLTGIASNSGLSGSTAWHNSVRARMYLKSADEVDDPALRVLEVKKNNYGPVSETILLRWRNGVYVPEPRDGSFEQLAEECKADNLFIELLRSFAKQGRNVCDKRGTTYAPAIFAEEPKAKKAKATNKHLADAMRRLFDCGKIRVETEGPASKPRSKLVEVRPSTNPSTNPPPPSTNPSTPPPHTPPMVVEGGRGGGSHPPSTTGERKDLRPEPAEPAADNIEPSAAGRLAIGLSWLETDRIAGEVEDWARDKVDLSQTAVVEADPPARIVHPRADAPRWLL